MSRLVLYKGEVCKVINLSIEWVNSKTGGGGYYLEYSKGWEYNQKRHDQFTLNNLDKTKKYYWVSGLQNYPEILDCELTRVIYG